MKTAMTSGMDPCVWYNCIDKEKVITLKKWEKCIGKS